MRTIGVVTVARSDYGLYRPILKRINSASDLRLHLVASGSHLSPEFGSTVEEIEADGFKIADRVEMLLSSDSPEGVAKSMGLGLIGFSQVYARTRLDLLLVLGDRYEMHAAALAALPFRIPVAHIHGGEVTVGAFDDALRHSITKLSHLHFTSTEEYARRVIQLGEDSNRVFVTGAPGLDNLRETDLMSPDEFQSAAGFPLREPFLLVTYHPVTLEYEQTESQIEDLLGALERIGLPALFTGANADTHGRLINDRIKRYVQSHTNCKVVSNLGTKLYFSAMNFATGMVGNSSSGIIEAASFGLPVVNVGDRQKGRVRGKNVIDTLCSQEAIVEGVRRALNPGFRKSLVGLANLYGDGTAAERIVRVLSSVPLEQSLITKVFRDLPGTTSMTTGSGTASQTPAAEDHQMIIQRDRERRDVDGLLGSGRPSSPAEAG